MRRTEKAIGLNPKFPQAYNGMGAALAASGNETDAIAVYRKAIELSPKYVDAMNNLGAALVNTQQWDQAIPFTNGRSN